jgi:hypothetical protein
MRFAYDHPDAPCTGVFIPKSAGAGESDVTTARPARRIDRLDNASHRNDCVCNARHDEDCFPTFPEIGTLTRLGNAGPALYYRERGRFATVPTNVNQEQFE